MDKFHAGITLVQYSLIVASIGLLYASFRGFMGDPDRDGRYTSKPVVVATALVAVGFLLVCVYLQSVKNEVMTLYSRPEPRNPFTEGDFYYLEQD